MDNPFKLKKKIANIHKEKNCGSGNKYERTATYFLKL